VCRRRSINIEKHRNTGVDYALYLAVRRLLRGHRAITSDDEDFCPMY
jgi:hypothetical protein